MLIVAAMGLLDVAETRRLWKMDPRRVCSFDHHDVPRCRARFWTTLMAVVIAVLGWSSRPPDAVLGRVNGLKENTNIVHHEQPQTWPSVLLYRFESALVFYKSPYFKKHMLELATSRHSGIKWFVVDGGPINAIDSTGADMLEALAGDLQRAGMRLGFANLRTEVRGWNAPA